MIFEFALKKETLARSALLPPEKEQILLDHAHKFIRFLVAQYRLSLASILIILNGLESITILIPGAFHWGYHRGCFLPPVLHFMQKRLYSEFLQEEQKMNAVQHEEETYFVFLKEEQKKPKEKVSLLREGAYDNGVYSSIDLSPIVRGKGRIILLPKEFSTITSWEQWETRVSSVVVHV